MEDAMTMARCLLWIACGFVLGACAGDELLVGDLRCEGEGVACERPRALQHEGAFAETTALAETDATLKWETDLPCPSASCVLTQDPSLVVHGDGSTTIVLVHQASDEGRSESTQHIWVGHFDAGGHQSWQNEEFAFEALNFAGLPLSVALALDTNDGALLAVERNDGNTRELTVYRMTDTGKAARLFRTEGLDALSGMAVDGDDVVIAGYYWTQSFDDAPNPELARYHLDGTLVWRQSALRVSDGSGLSQHAIGLVLIPPMHLELDAKGRATLIVPDVAGNLVTRVDRDGNVAWTAAPAPVAQSPIEPPALSLDTEGRAVIAFEHYVLMRIAVLGDPPDHIEDLSAFRGREEFWDPVILGFAHDAQNRALVATMAGTKEAPRLVIDRTSADFTQRETFAVPGAEDVVRSPKGLGSLGTVGPRGIRVGDDGDVYFCSQERIGRIALPEARAGSAPPAPSGAAGSGE
jgi:hypothetical protein